VAATPDPFVQTIVQSNPTRLLHHYGHSGSRKRVSG
jgi:hypothetical protein